LELAAFQLILPFRRKALELLVASLLIPLAGICKMEKMTLHNDNSSHRTFAAKNKDIHIQTQHKTYILTFFFSARSGFLLQ